ncbi:MAG TPA: DUF1349 domain-containing protein [Chthoniobacterales bacterium]|nr:DUF1349 domain-containing protein [Chthoniobacterales bacterium]
MSIRVEEWLMQWLNEPPAWKSENNLLSVVTGANTDFWRVTHYGFIRDNGHFYYQDRTGDFTVQVKVTARYETLYDQAGIMIRMDAANWIKTGVEYTDGLPHFSAVVTRDFSDWSVLPADSLGPVWLRLTRLGNSVRIQYSIDGLSFLLLRLAYFPETTSTQVGLMCCSPEREGFEVEFSEFQISEPVGEGLHQ